MTRLFKVLGLQMAARVFLISILYISFSVNAVELDLSTPHATFKSCMFYQYEHDSIPLGFASEVISNCFTTDGKFDFFSHLLLGVIVLDSLESSRAEKIDKIIKRYGDGEIDEGFEKNILSLEVAELNALILELVELTNEYNPPESSFERKLLDVKYEKETAKGIVASFRPKRKNEYEILFKKMPRGWLIHEVSGAE